MRFLCDEMLRGLAKWLRAAGYDTTQAPESASDRRLLNDARAQGRYLLTRDHKILERRDAHHITWWLGGQGIDTWARQLRHDHGLNWCYRPFSRCLRCNQPLDGPLTALTGAELPASVHERQLAVYRCQQCERYYWEGDHVRRMKRRLHAWQSLEIEPHEKSD